MLFHCADIDSQKDMIFSDMYKKGTALRPLNLNYNVVL